MLKPTTQYILHRVSSIQTLSLSEDYDSDNNYDDRGHLTKNITTFKPDRVDTKFFTLERGSLSRARKNPLFSAMTCSI